MKWLPLSFCFSLFLSPILAQEELPTMLEGEWIGALEYLDYQDNTTRVSLPVKLSVSGKGNKLKLKFGYVEPNGKIIRSKNKIRMEGDALEWDGALWMIMAVEGDPEMPAGWRMVLQREGEDDDRAATLRQTILRKQNELTIRKEVRYQSDDAFSFRNVYRFNKSAPSLNEEN